MIHPNDSKCAITALSQPFRPSTIGIDLGSESTPWTFVINLRKTILSGNSEDLSAVTEWRHATLPWG